MKSKLLKVLSGIGLGDNEASVYLAGLKLGPTTVLKLSNETGIKRTTIYNVLENLRQKGVSKIIQFGWKQRYEMLEPQSLMKLVDQKRDDLKLSIEDLTKIQTKQNYSDSIEYFEGVASIKSVYDRIIEETKKGDFYYIISDTNKWYEKAPGFFDDFIDRRSRMGFDIKALLTPSQKTDEHIEYQAYYGMQVRELPEKSNLTTNLVVVPSMAIIHQLEDRPFVTVTRNKHTINMYKEIFELLWRK